MTRHVIPAVPQTPNVVTRRWHRAKFAGMFALLFLGVGGVGVVAALSTEGTEQLVYVSLAVCVYAGLLATAYALAWPRAQHLVLDVDSAADGVQVPNWWGIPALVLLALVAGTFAGLAGLVRQVAHPELDLSRRELALPLLCVLGAYGLVKFFRARAHFSRLVLTSDVLEARQFLRGELVEWRDIWSIDLVARPRVRIRIVHEHGVLEVVPGPFDSDRRLMTDLLRAVWRDPTLLDDLDQMDVRTILEPA